MYFSRRSGRNNKLRLFLLSAALRVSARADERTLQILSELKRCGKNTLVLINDK